MVRLECRLATSLSHHRHPELFLRLLSRLRLLFVRLVRAFHTRTLPRIFIHDDCNRWSTFGRYPRSGNSRFAVTMCSILWIQHLIQRMYSMPLKIVNNQFWNFKTPKDHRDIPKHFRWLKCTQYQRLDILSHSWWNFSYYWPCFTETRAKARYSPINID